MITQTQFLTIKAKLKFSSRMPLSAFLLKHGTWQRGNALCDKYKTQSMGYCFENAWKIEKKHKLEYWEGYAWCPSVTGEVFYHHAWCVDPASGEIIDVTWSDSATCLYRGVHIPTSKLQEIIGRSRVYGALDRGHGFETEIVKSLFGWTPKNSETQMPRERSFSDYLKRQKWPKHLESNP